jgi:hypothetical protein
MTDKKQVLSVSPHNKCIPLLMKYQYTITEGPDYRGTWMSTEEYFFIQKTKHITKYNKHIYGVQNHSNMETYDCSYTVHIFAYLLK